MGTWEQWADQVTRLRSPRDERASVEPLLIPGGGTYQHPAWHTQLPADWGDGTAHAFWSAAYARAGVSDPVAVEAAVRSNIADELGCTNETEWRRAMDDDMLMAANAHLLEPPGSGPAVVDVVGDRVIVVTGFRAFALDRSSGELTGWLAWPARPTGTLRLDYIDVWDKGMSAVLGRPARAVGWSGVVASWTHVSISRLCQQRPAVIAWQGGLLTDIDRRCAVYDPNLVHRGWLVDRNNAERYPARALLWRGEVAALISPEVAELDVPRRTFQCQHLPDRGLRLHTDGRPLDDAATPPHHPPRQYAGGEEDLFTANMVPA